MALIYTAEYLARAPKAQISVTYPDGAVYASDVLDDGSGFAAAVVRASIVWPWCPRNAAGARCSRVGHAPAAELSRWTDMIRDTHRRAGRAWAQEVK